MKHFWKRENKQELSFLKQKSSVEFDLMMIVMILVRWERHSMKMKNHFWCKYNLHLWIKITKYIDAPMTRL